MHALLAVEEGRGAGDDEEQAREPPRVDLVEQLTQGVEALLPDVAAHALQRLDLVQHDEQPGMSAVPQHRQQALEEAERTEVVEVSADTGGTPGGGGHGLLPPSQAISASARLRHPRSDLPVAAQGRGERRRGSCDIGQPLFQQHVHGLRQLLASSSSVTPPASSTSSRGCRTRNRLPARSALGRWVAVVSRSVSRR